jgi:hypothetical protein
MYCSDIFAMRSDGRRGRACIERQHLLQTALPNSWQKVLAGGEHLSGLLPTPERLPVHLSGMWRENAAHHSRQDNWKNIFIKIR